MTKENKKLKILGISQIKKFLRQDEKNLLFGNYTCENLKQIIWDKFEAC